MTELRSIDYPDIPEVAIRELEAFFDHDDEDKNFLSLIAEEVANFPARVLDKIHALAEEGAGRGSCNPRADVICEVFIKYSGGYPLLDWPVA